MEILVGHWKDFKRDLIFLKYIYVYISMFLFVDAVGEGRGSRLVHQLQDVQPRDPDNTVKK